jgi:mono/diheme cytochrome c family protein
MRVTPRLGLIAVLVLGACDSATEERREVTASRVVMRPYTALPPGTVPRGAAAYAEALAPPGPGATPERVRRGGERYGVFCSPCHGARGYGDGTVVAHGFPRPPSLHQEKLREAPPEHVVAVITNGIGKMYPYAERVPPEERWAIAYFVKALQANPAMPMGGQEASR